jgi:hypothetical protein
MPLSKHRLVHILMAYLQSKLPQGATLLGTILSSDKTNITAMTGGRVAHLLLISSSNISMDF